MMQNNHVEKGSEASDEYRLMIERAKGPREDLTVVGKDLKAAAPGEKGPERETWGKKVDFLLSIIGFAVDLANVWRFPYLCYKNGGGAFLIPYFSMLIFGAMPLFYMELILGQFHRTGCIGVWKIAPIFRGIGMAECFVAYIVAFYYNVIIAWSFFYLFSSFTSTLPWTKCDQSWNTQRCTTGKENFTYFLRHNATPYLTMTSNMTSLPSFVNTSNRTGLNQGFPEISHGANITLVSSATEYFERGVLALHESTGLHDLGTPRWQLTLCLLAVFVVLYFSLWKGIKSSGKVVWVTATMPYVVLLILLIRGVMLPGSLKGILYFITPSFDRLLDSKVWIDAAIQIFYSVGAGFGTHLAYASYNKFNNNCYKDCLFTVFVNSFTSIFSGFVIFSYIGYMSVIQDKAINEVAQEGPGLVFMIYPEAIATLPGSPGWAVIFFIMLLTLGLDSAMGGLEAVMTGLQDEYRNFMSRWKYSREIFTAVICFSAFLFAIPNVTPGGMYLLTLLDTFAAGSSLLVCVLFQAIAIGWVYGLPQFCADAEKMLGFRPGIYWRLCWKFISPLFVMIIVVSSFVSFTPLRYESSTGEYVYPSWSNTLGWLISASSMVMIPAAAIYQMLVTPGTFTRRLAINISPFYEHRAIDQGQEVKRFKMKHWLSM